MTCAASDAQRDIASLSAPHWLLRVGSLVGVGVVWLAIRTSALDPPAQSNALLFLASGLGYGHVLGALIFGRRRRRGAPQRLLFGIALLAAGVAFAQTLLASMGPALLVSLAVLAVWHTLENELAVARAARGSLRLPPLSRAPGPHLFSAGAALAIVAGMILLPRLAPWLVGVGAPLWLVRTNPEEVLGALLLYHTLVWLGRSLTAAGAGAWGSRQAALVGLHTLPAILLVVLGQLPSASPLAFAASPALFLFASVAHAFHTCLERGLEPAR